MSPHHARTAWSLHHRQPRHTPAVASAILASTLLLLLGLSLPLMDAQTGILWARWKNSYSVWAGVVALWEDNEILLALVLFFFSMVFPIAKLSALSVIWFMALPEEQRERLLRWLEVLGKWSMLDVFVVAILIVLVKLGPLAKVEPRSVVYVFAAAIACSMLTTMYVTYLAHRHPPRPA